MELAFPSGPGPSTFAGDTKEVLDWEDGHVSSEDHEDHGSGSRLLMRLLFVFRST